MFGTIRKHQNWLWAIIITIIILSFVVFFSPDIGRGGGGRRRTAQGEYGSIEGKPISVEEYRLAHDEARLAHFIRSGGQEWPSSRDEENLKRSAIERVFLDRKVREMNIEVSDEAVGRVASERFGNPPKDQLPTILARFEQEKLLPNRLNLGDFERFMRHEAALQQLYSAAGVTARLMNPKEAETMFRKEHQEAITEVALFTASNHLDKVKATPEDVSKFFTNNMAMYRVPERIQVAYVEFSATNYFAEADKRMAGITNFDAQIEDYYYKKGTNTFKGSNDVVLSAEEAKKKIKEDERQRQGLMEARRKAYEFAVELEAQPGSEKLETFEKFAAAKGLPIRLSEPFDRNSGATNFPPEFRAKAMMLKPEVAVQLTPITGEDAVYVIALKNRIPSEMPPFEKVQEKVTMDFKLGQARDLARQAATNFYASVTNALQAKRPFSDVVAQSNVKLIVPPPFSRSTTSLTNLDEKLRLEQLQHLAFENNLKPGDVSGIIPTVEGAMLMHLKEIRPVGDVKLRAELPEYLRRLQAYRQREAFGQWLRKQEEQARVVIPQPEMPVAPGGQRLPQRRS
jgi:hypothetical protein